MSRLLLIAGCTSSAADSGEPALDTTAEPSGFAVSGVTLDLSGEPAVDMFVTVTTEFCTPDQTDEAGAFSVENVAAGDKLLVTYGETASNGLFASVVFPFHADAALTLAEPVLTPRLTEAWTIDPGAQTTQTVQSNDGLLLTIEPGALTLAPFMAEAIQVARVPAEMAPPFSSDGVELLDLFVLHPILSSFDPPAPISFPADTGLEPGTTVTFHALDYSTGLLTAVATGTIDKDGRPTTDPGQGIPELTWIGLSVESP